MEKYLKTTMSNEEMATDSEFEETEGTEEIKESSLLCRTFHPDEMFSKRTTPEYCARRIREIVAAYRPEWTPEDLRDRLTPELATGMGLWPLIKRLPCPDELNPKKDLCFIAWALPLQVLLGLRPLGRRPGALERASAPSARPSCSFPSPSALPPPAPQGPECPDGQLSCVIPAWSRA